jgi:hypothetical protein
MNADIRSTTTMMMSTQLQTRTRKRKKQKKEVMKKRLEREQPVPRLAVLWLEQITLGHSPGRSLALVLALALRLLPS